MVSERELRDIYQMRVVLKSLAARLSVRNACCAQVATLVATAEELHLVYAGHAIVPFLRAKARSFEALFAGASNEVAAVSLGTNNRAAAMTVEQIEDASAAAMRALLHGNQADVAT